MGKTLNSILRGKKTIFFWALLGGEVGDVGLSRRKLPKIGRSDDKRTRSISRCLYKLIKIALDFRIVKGWLLDFLLQRVVIFPLLWLIIEVVGKLYTLDFTSI